MLYKALLLFFTLSFSFLSEATSYSRGSWHCDNFEEAREDHKTYPDSVHLEMGYSMCLITKGEDNEALIRLRHIVKNQNNVKAASLIAYYIRTDGRLDGSTDENRIDEAIQAYFKVLSLIDFDPNYPYDGYIAYERESQTELNAASNVPKLYIIKFWGGAHGIYNQHLLSSPSYKGDRDLKTYPQYSPYTIDSLNKVIQFANECLALPGKPHFQLNAYIAHQKACQILKNAGTALQPLEEQRLVLLAGESCKDLPQCPEYDELANEINFLLKQTVSRLTNIFTSLTEKEIASQ